MEAALVGCTRTGAAPLCRGAMHACLMVLFPASACIGSGHPQRPPVMPFSRIRMHEQSTRGRPPDNPTSVPFLWDAYITHPACTWERTQATRPRKTSPPRGSLVAACGRLYSHPHAGGGQETRARKSAAQRRAEGRKACKSSESGKSRAATYSYASACRTPKCEMRPYAAHEASHRTAVVPSTSQARAEPDMPFAQWGSARATRVAAELARPKLAT